MKTIKNTLAIFFAAILAFATFAVSAAAIPGGSITIHETVSSVSIDGKTFNAYKVFDVTTDGAGKYAYTFANASVASYFAAKSPSITTAPNAVSYINTLGAEDFAKELYAAITGGSIVITPSTATGSGSTAVFTGLDAGYFFIYDATTGATVTKSACILATNDADVNINIKSDLPTIVKKITNGINSSQDATFADTGDSINFELDSTVPNMTGYDKYFFIIKDNLSYLTLAADWQDHLVVKIGGTTIASSNYTATVTGGNHIEIVFKNFIQYKSQAGAAIVVTYSATYAPGTTDATSVNEAYITYSNNPLYDYTATPGDVPGGSDPTADSTKDEVKVYSFSVDLTKVDGADHTTLLAGAEFQLYQYNGTTWVLVKTLTTAAAGTVSFGQLSSGQYRLVESVAPNGYNRILDPIDFTVNATFSGTNIATFTVNNADFTADLGAKTVSATIENNAGSILPGTGGIGTTIFYILGVVIMAGAIVVFFVLKKRKAEVNG